MRLKIASLVGVVLLLLSTRAADAKYSQSAQVKYETEEGWSHWYTVETHFLTGSELNSVTGSFRYSMFGTYAVIFWGQNKASVIKLEGLYFCGTEADPSCIANHIMTPHGKDQEGREWKVCVSGFCF